MENVQDQVKPNRDQSSKCKSPRSLPIRESEEDDEEYVRNDEEVKNDDEDVCDSMTKEVGSSYNSPDVKIKTSIEGEVDKEPGGMFPQEVAV